MWSCPTCHYAILSYWHCDSRMKRPEVLLGSTQILRAKPVLLENQFHLTFFFYFFFNRNYAVAIPSQLYYPFSETVCLQLSRKQAVPIHVTVTLQSRAGNETLITQSISQLTFFHCTRFQVRKVFPGVVRSVDSAWVLLLLGRKANNCVFPWGHLNWAPNLLCQRE